MYRGSCGVLGGISIHAPRVGSDCDVRHFLLVRHDFNPRSPCGERHWCFFRKILGLPISIHAPRVGSDSLRRSEMLALKWISIHAPRVGSDRSPLFPDKPRGISIHAPRVGSDSLSPIVLSGSIGFQSTLPVWGATCDGFEAASDFAISIHAPRVGSDKAASRPSKAFRYFNPRSPCGERLQI